MPIACNPHQEAVLEFHKTFSCTISEEPALPSDKDMELRINLINEEAGEFVDGCENLVEAADALGDLLYVIYGASITYGVYFEHIKAFVIPSLPSATSPTVPLNGSSKLLAALIKWKAAEFEVYARARQIENVRKSLDELLFTTYSIGFSYGIDLSPVLMEIHRSNMTKLWTDKEIESVGPDSQYEGRLVSSTGDRHWLVKRKADGKVMKSPSYSGADLERVLKELDEKSRKPFLKPLQEEKES